MSIACGHLESHRGSLQGLGWLLRRSQGTHFLPFVAAGDEGAHLFPLCAVTSPGQGGMLQKVKQAAFYQETQVFRNTIKEILIDRNLHPSRKQNWIQTFSKLSCDKYSGRQAEKYRCLMHPCEPICLSAATQKVQHEG